jgi:hypothetical protein
MNVAKKTRKRHGAIMLPTVRGLAMGRERNEWAALVQ